MTIRWKFVTLQPPAYPNSARFGTAIPRFASVYWRPNQSGGRCISEWRSRSRSRESYDADRFGTADLSECLM